jgi:psiF repeat
MKRLVALLCCAALAGPALAQDKAQKEPSEKQKAQQQRTKDCNKEAADKKMQGDARKTFLSSCIKGA